ncbi:peptide/nickel transport system ATP-binding protein [Roseovarius marisflavi]|uniref:Peptide/nickel transport system ATP-binding protein n=1 Tax=Roseovarius marisflavi TaxID=1054996 RepID=A0A1M7DQK4_9RHOB|nr:ABC transporter ATP-binding protein [Roseovarius marisflavi]SHL81762.1 peptide/nickel transport system ATP-binding protein [Roseovarius marisflavi]
MTRLLDITDLHIALPADSQRPYAVQKMDLHLEANEILCVVGESGSGKSLTARAVMGLLPKPHVRIAKGSVLFQGEDLTTVSDDRLRQIRGSEISMIFQEPMTALNPVMTIGTQIDEVFRFHDKMPGKERRRRALELLRDVQLPDPEQAIKAYPHELSGGQRQRAMIAMALALDPKILIADEPTTALDVTTQAQVLKLIKEMQATHGTGVLFITHDFGVVADIADRVAVMQNGLVVETGTTDEVLRNPTHPYTQALIAAVPELTPRPARARSPEIVLRVNKLEKTYRSGGGLFGGKERIVHAANDVTFNLARSETLGIVGESGSGKSTVARCIVRLNDAEAGEILLGDTDLRPLGRAAMRPYRSKIQMVFQDPFASLNPRTRIGKIIAQGPMMYGASAEDAKKRTLDLLDIVGLDPRAYGRFPHEFSGGQRQRIGIARALALEPDILVADEPVSALDVSIQAQILNLLDEIRDRMNLSMIFITHDLRVAAQVCDRIAVMQRGKMIEIGPTSTLFASPKETYTRELLAAVPGKDWFLKDSDAKVLAK